MDKLLTVSVAAYNVEDTLVQCLNSCVEAGKSGRLEVIVVDDGSSDGTAKIAEQYAGAHPHVFRVLRKENGGYGTTVNASLAVARGKYYRLLDGDDWFDSDALVRLLYTLERCNADLVVSPFVKRFSGKNEVVDQIKPGFDMLQRLEGDFVADTLSMHAIAYRTSILHAIKFQLPEHRLYTDALFASIPLQYVETVYVTHDPLYQYRLGIEGQSVSQKSYEAHYKDLEALVEDLLVQYLACDDRSSLSSRILLNWISGNATRLMRVLYGMSPSKKIWQSIRKLVTEMHIDPVIEDACKSTGKAYRILENVPYALYPAVSSCYRLWRSKS